MAQNLKKNYLLNVSFQILRVLTSLITAPYLARTLGPVNTGIFEFTFANETYFSLFAALGVISYGSREIARNRDNKKERSLLFWEIEGLVFFTSFICLIGYGFFIYLNTQYQTYYLILTIGLLATTFDISWFFTGIEKFSSIVIRNCIVRILEVIAIFIFVKDDGDLIYYFLIMMVGLFSGNFSLWFSLKNEIEKVSIKEIHIFRHFKGILIFFLPAIATSMYSVLDKTFIGIITKDEAQNGYYEYATKIINIAKAVTFTSLNMVIGPRNSYLYKNNQTEEIKTRLSNSLDYMLFLAFGFSFGLMGVSSLFVPFFLGDKFVPAVPVLVALCPLVIIIAVSNALGYQYYDPVGLRLKSAGFLLIGGVSNVWMNLLLIPKYGCLGAAIASVIAEFIISSLYLINCDGYLTLQKLLQISWKKAIAASFMLSFLLYIKSFLKINLWGNLIAICSGGLIYLGILLLLKDTGLHMILTLLKKENRK